MDNGLCISKEHTCNGQCDHSCSVSKVEYFDFDEKIFPLSIVYALLFEACLKINDEDLSERESKRYGDIEIEYSLVEMRYAHYKTNGCKFKIAFQDEKPIGLLVYQKIFTGIYVVRILYLVDSTRGTKSGKGLINSLGDTCAIVFQTRKEKPPVEALNHTKTKVLLHEDPLFQTWLMKWEK